MSEQEETGFLIGATGHLERVSRQTQAGLGAKKKKWRILSQFPDWPVQRILVGESPKARRCMTQFPRMRQIQESREDQIEWAQAVQYIVSQEQGPRAMSRERHNHTVLKK